MTRINSTVLISTLIKNFTSAALETGTSLRKCIHEKTRRKKSSKQLGKEEDRGKYFPYTIHYIANFYHALSYVLHHSVKIVITSQNNRDFFFIEFSNADQS